MSGGNKKSNIVKNAAKSFVKKKCKSAIKGVILKNPFVLGILIFLVIILAVICSISGDIGEMGDNTVTAEVSESANKDIIENLQEYLDEKINVGIPDWLKYNNDSGSGGAGGADVGSTVSANFHSNNDLVKYAMNFLGRPYLWGGNGPERFDCSGLTCYIYKHFGVTLPRIASDQQQVGTAVSRENLKPGDLVFFGSPAHHVGMYVGDNKYIQAPKSGDVVKISELNRSDYSGARRIINKASDDSSSDSSGDSSSDSTSDADISSDSDTNYSDAFNIIRKFYLSPGNVFGYMRFMEMSLGVKPQHFFQEAEKKKDEKEAEQGTDLEKEKDPGTVSQIAEMLIDETGIPEEITKKKIESNARKVADELKPIFTLDTKTETDVVTTKTPIKILGKDTGKSITTSTTNKNPIAIVTHISSIYGEIDLQYTEQTNTYTDADGTHSVTKPVYSGYTLQGKLFDRFREIIKKDFPEEENVDDAIYFSVESGFDFDQKEQKGDWINGNLSDITLDMLLGTSGDSGGMYAEIPLFYQWDSRWGSTSFGGSTMSEAGAAPTCLAMVVSGTEGKLGNYDSNSDGILEPNEARDFMQSNGVGTDSDAYKGFYAAPSTFGLTMNHYSSDEYDKVISELKQGHPVIANVHGNEGIPYGQAGSTFSQGNHYIVLVSIDSNNKVTVRDPYGKNDQNKHTFDFSTIIAPETSDYYAFNNPNIVYKDGIATAYNAGDSNQGWGDCTSVAMGFNVMNMTLKSHLLAVDKSIPLGTIIVIKVLNSSADTVKLEDGSTTTVSGAFAAVDTGGAIGGSHFDVYFGPGANGSYNKRIADNFGVQKIKYRITKQKISEEEAAKR